MVRETGFFSSAAALHPPRQAPSIRIPVWQRSAHAGQPTFTNRASVATVSRDHDGRSDAHSASLGSVLRGRRPRLPHCTQSNNCGGRRPSRGGGGRGGRGARRVLRYVQSFDVAASQERWSCFVIKLIHLLVHHSCRCPHDYQQFAHHGREVQHMGHPLSRPSHLPRFLSEQARRFADTHATGIKSVPGGSLMRGGPRAPFSVALYAQIVSTAWTELMLLSSALVGRYFANS